MNQDSYRTAQHDLFKSLAQGSASTTIVPLRTQYEDVAFCLSFIHLLDRSLSQLISQQIIDPLRAIEPRHHWYATDDLHLTIKNVRSAAVGRSYAPSEVQGCVAALRSAAPTLVPMDFEILGPTALPTSIVLRAFGNPDHRRAVLDLDKCLTEVGMADDKKYGSSEVFVGNITIGRFTQQPSDGLKARVSALSSTAFGTYNVGSLQLIECDEVCSSSSRVVHASIVLSDRQNNDGASV